MNGIKSRLAIGAVVPLLLVGCSSSAATPSPAPPASQAATAAATASPVPTATPQKKLTIGITVPTLNDYVSAEVKAYNAEAAKLGNVEVKVLTDNSDAAAEKSNVEQLIASKVDGIVLWPIDSGPAVNLVDEISAANIPVVAVNNQVGTQTDVYSKLVGFVGRNDVAEGELVANWLKQQLGGKSANVVEIRGQLGSAPESRRTQGFNNVFGNDPTIHIIAQPGIQDWSSQGALDAIDAVLAKTKDIQVVYTHAAFFSVPVAKELKTAGVDMTKCLVTGFDYDQASKQAFTDGILAATVYYDQAIEGSQALDTLVNFIRTGTKPAQSWIKPPEVLLTKDNYQQYQPTY